MYHLDTPDALFWKRAVVRTGGSWRMLPREFPHWNNVYKTFRRWSAQGKFEQMHDRLRAQWRERVDRDEWP